MGSGTEISLELPRPLLRLHRNSYVWSIKSDHEDLFVDFRIEIDRTSQYVVPPMIFTQIREAGSYVEYIINRPENDYIEVCGSLDRDLDDCNPSLDDIESHPNVKSVWRSTTIEGDALIIYRHGSLDGWLIGRRTALAVTESRYRWASVQPSSDDGFVTIFLDDPEVEESTDKPPHLTMFDDE